MVGKSKAKAAILRPEELLRVARPMKKRRVSNHDSENEELGLADDEKEIHQPKRRRSQKATPKKAVVKKDPIAKAKAKPKEALSKGPAASKSTIFIGF